MNADYTASASAVAAFRAVVCWSSYLFIVIMANTYRNADLSLAIFGTYGQGADLALKLVIYI